MKMRTFFSLLGLLFYSKSPWYVINKITYKSNNRVTYWLYRKDYILGFIPRLVPIDGFTTEMLYDKKISEWHKLYGQTLNTKYTIIEKEYKSIK